MVSAADRLGQHVDSGLFNIVVGTAADVAPIHLHLGGEGECRACVFITLHPAALRGMQHAA